MGKFVILAVLICVGVFAAVSLANATSGSVQSQRQAKSLEGKALDVGKAAKRSRRFGIRYLFAGVDLAPGETKGRTFKCPRRWHPVSGLFNPDSDQVVAAADAPVTERKWLVRVRNQGPAHASVMVGAVCEKGLRLLRPA